MKNAVFDKTMEKLTNATDIRLVSNKKDYLNAHQNQALCHKKKICNDLVAKVTLTLNKPAYAGMCILDLSKVLM